MAVNTLWPDPNAPQQGFTLPAPVGPMAFPVQKPKRRWGRAVFAWTLCVFAGGIAAGPTLQEYAYQGVDAAAFFIITNAPPWVSRYIPPSPDHLPPPSRTFAAPTALPPATPAAEPAEPATAESPPAPAPVADRRPTSTAPQIQPLAAQPEEAPVSEPRASTRGKHGRAVAKAVTHETPPPPAPVARKSRQTDPFETAASNAEATPQKREAAMAAPPKSEPAPKKGRNNDGLDDLMGGMTNEGSPAAKGKRSTSREIDDMLKDVQKSEPPPPPKKSEPASLPPLTASDISKAMAAVKARANECGKSLGQKGMAELKLTVGRDGRVSNVTVSGKSAGSPLGDCVARAARAASFPPNAGLKFDYRIDVR